MSTTPVTFSSSEISVRYRESLLSDAINRTTGTLLPDGVYSGFKMKASVVNNEITVVASATGEHAACVGSISGSYPGRSIALHRSGGDFNVAIPQAAATYYVCLQAAYTAAGNTSSYIIVYTSAEFAALSSTVLAGTVVLGTVARTGALDIPAAASILYTSRQEAWQGKGEGEVPWVEVVKNGGFELTEGTAGYSGSGPYKIPYWVQSISTANASWATAIDTVVRPGYKGSACLSFITSNVAAQSGSVTQAVSVPVTPGSHVTISLYKKVYLAPSAGSVQVTLGWYDKTGVVSSYSTRILDMSSVGSYNLDTIDFSVPATAATLYSATLDVINYTRNPSGLVFSIDDFSVKVKSDNLDAAYRGTPSLGATYITNTLIINDRPVGIGTFAAVIDVSTNDTDPGDLGTMRIKGVGAVEVDGAIIGNSTAGSAAGVVGVATAGGVGVQGYGPGSAKGIEAVSVSGIGATVTTNAASSVNSLEVRHTGNGTAVFADGGDSTHPVVRIDPTTNGSGNVIGIQSLGKGTGFGGIFTGGSGGAGARGVMAVGGSAGGEGVYAQSVASGFSAVYGTGGGGGAAAIVGVGTGAGDAVGVQGTGLAAGPGGKFAPASTSTPLSANINLPPLTTDPSTLANGDIWITGTNLSSKIGGTSKNVAFTNKSASFMYTLLPSPATGSPGVTPIAFIEDAIGVGGAVMLPFSCAANNLYAKLGTAGSAGTYTVTIYKDGVSTLLSCVVTATSTALFSDTTHSISFSAGSLIEIRYSGASVTGSPANLRIAFSLTQE